MPTDTVTSLFHPLFDQSSYIKWSRFSPTMCILWWNSLFWYYWFLVFLRWSLIWCRWSFLWWFFWLLSISIWWCEVSSCKNSATGIKTNLPDFFSCSYAFYCSCLPRHLLLFQREIPRLLFKLLTFLMAQSRQRCYRPQLHSWLRILYKGGAVLNSHSTEKKRKRTNTESLTPTVATIWTNYYCSIRCESPIYLILLITLTLAFSSTHNRRMS